MYIPVAKPLIGREEKQRVLEVLETRFVAQGKATNDFELQIASYLGSNCAIGTNSGTSALHIALIGLGARQTSSVLTTAVSFVATANAIRYTGATPVFVDVGYESLNISFEHLQAVAADYTDLVGVVPVHLMGIPADIYSIVDWAQSRNLFVIEDAALALGTLYKERLVGTIADAGIFSFYGSKTITTGEGGMVVTDDRDLGARLKLLRSHGQSPDRKYWHTVVGYSYQLSDIQSAVGIAQIQRIGEITQRKRTIARTLRRAVAGLDCFKLLDEPEGADIVYFAFPLLVRKAKWKSKVLALLAERQIETRPIFCVLPALDFYPHSDVKRDFPNSCDIARRGFFISCSPTLSDLELEYLVESLREIDRRVLKKSTG